jgi:toxin-antitoxin system PIN domain toxin
MKVVDLNLLLYAVNSGGAHHARARAWLEQVFSSDETVALPWVVLLGFLRISTNPRALARPLSVEDAVAVVESWLERANISVLSPGESHWSVLRGLLLKAGTAGNLSTDAHLAALAIENDAELCSTDADFSRFSGLRWVNPVTE